MSFWHPPRSFAPFCNHIVPPFIAISSGVLFKSILHGNLPLAQILIVHALNCQITRLEAIITHKPKPLTLIGHVIPHDPRRANDRPKGAKGVIQQFLIHISRIQVPNEQIGPHVQTPLTGLLVQTALADPHGPPVQFHHAQYLNGVLGVHHVEEFDEAVAGVEAGEFVLGHVDGRDAADLGEELDEEGVVDGGVEVADIDCGFLVAVFYIG